MLRSGENFGEHMVALITPRKRLIIGLIDRDTNMFFGIGIVLLFNIHCINSAHRAGGTTVFIFKIQ